MPFSIVRNDITKMKADAIVNSANSAPEIGGGSDYAVYQAAGAESLLSARKRIGYIRPGEASLTRGFDLPARYVIHTVAPLWEDGASGEEETLRNCYKSCLRIAKRKHLKSVAFPLLAAGTLGFPKDKALTIALSEIQQFLMNSEMMVWLAVFDRSSFQLSENLSKNIEEFIDDHYARTKAVEEYLPGTGKLYANTSILSDYDYQERERLIRERRERLIQERREQLIQERRERIREQYEIQFDRYEDVKSSDEDSDKDFGEFMALLSDLDSETEMNYMPDQDSEPDVSYHASMRPPSQEAAPPAMPHAARPSRPSSDREEKKQISAERRARKYSEPRFSAAPSAPHSVKKRSMDDVLDELGETFQQALMRMIRERGYDNKEVYKRANLDRKVFSKIKSNPNYSPKKSTAIALAIALRLNMDEARDLLGRAGFAFSPGIKSDLIVEYFIENGVYDVYTIDTALFEHDLPMLSSY